MEGRGETEGGELVRELKSVNEACKEREEEEYWKETDIHRKKAHMEDSRGKK